MASSWLDHAYRYTELAGHMNECQGKAGTGPAAGGCQGVRCRPWKSTAAGTGTSWQALQGIQRFCKAKHWPPELRRTPATPLRQAAA